MKSADSFAFSVGSYIARTRDVLGLTLDQIAQAARLYGASWSASSVRNLERGQASLTLPTLLVLALALGRLQGRPLSIAQLFSHSEELSLTEGEFGINVSNDWLKQVLGSQKVTYELGLQSELEVNERQADSALNRAQQLEQQRNEYLLNGQEVPKALKDELFRALDDARKTPPEPVTLAEKRAAEKLALEPSELKRYAIKLWGHTLEDESAVRAGEGSSPQARGRATRMLVDEIRKAVNQDGSPT